MKTKYILQDASDSHPYWTEFVIDAPHCVGAWSSKIRDARTFTSEERARKKIPLARIDGGCGLIEVVPLKPKSKKPTSGDLEKRITVLEAQVKSLQLALPKGIKHADKKPRRKR